LIGIGVLVAVLALVAVALSCGTKAPASAVPRAAKLAVWDWLLLVATPVPLFVMFVIPMLMHLSVRDRSSQDLTIASVALSVILFSVGCWRAIVAGGGQRKSWPARGVMIGATLVAGIPSLLLAVLIVLELITHGWSY
jgi:hypothetical protein